MKQLTDREVQLQELNVLKVLAGICDKLGLTYFLYYGTLIGAIRHNGFIPWDDDIDVAMPRPDYEKLVAYMQEHGDEYKPIVLMHHRLNPDYIYPIARLCDTNYYIEYEGAKDYGLGLFVDIYPLDGWGNRKIDKEIMFNRLAVRKQLVRLSSKDRFYSSNRSFLITIPKALMYKYARMVGSYTLIEKLDRSAMKIRYEDCDYVGNTSWAERKGTRTKKSNLIPIKWKFEDGEFNIPQGYDEMLRSTYGDYMSLPPIEERTAHHHYKAYKKD